MVLWLQTVPQAVPSQVRRSEWRRVAGDAAYQRAAVQRAVRQRVCAHERGRRPAGGRRVYAPDEACPPAVALQQRDDLHGVVGTRQQVKVSRLPLVDPLAGGGVTPRPVCHHL